MSKSPKSKHQCDNDQSIKGKYANALWKIKTVPRNKNKRTMHICIQSFPKTTETENIPSRNENAKQTIVLLTATQAGLFDRM